MLAPRSSKVAFLRAADFLFFLDVHMAEQAREIAKFRMELRPIPQVRPVTSSSFFLAAFANALIANFIDLVGKGRPQKRRAPSCRPERDSARI